jgi:uncharacterized membrane protein
MTTPIVPAMPPTVPATRLVYLDVLRGLAVLIMVFAHVVDSWTREADRHDFSYYAAIFVGGLGAPLFLFLAGLAQVMSANAKARRAGDRRAGAEAMWRRGWEVFVLGWLFRLQSQLLGWGALRNLFKVDILNVMGLSMVVAALLWRVSASRVVRIGVLLAATAVVSFATPIVRALAWPAALPDPLEAYIRPAGGYAAFTMFPWAGFLFAGAIVGELVDAMRTARVGLRLQAPLATAGLLGIALGWWASFLPSIYVSSGFWTSSPTIFFIKLGLATALVPAAWALCELLALSEPDIRRVEGWRPVVAITRAVELLGRSSLFVYWIHVEMVYGVIATPLKRSLPLWASLVATLTLCVALFYIVRLKNRRMEGVELPERLKIFAAVLK